MTCGSVCDYRSRCECNQTWREGRPTGVFTAVDRMVTIMHTPRYEENEPNKVPYKLRWGPAHNAGHWFDLRLAHVKGLEFLAKYQQCNHSTRFDARRLFGESCWKNSGWYRSGDAERKRTTWRQKILNAKRGSRWGWNQLLIQGMMEFQ